MSFAEAKQRILRVQSATVSDFRTVLPMTCLHCSNFGRGKLPGPKRILKMLHLRRMAAEQGNSYDVEPAGSLFVAALVQIPPGSVNNAPLFFCSHGLFRPAKTERPAGFDLDEYDSAAFRSLIIRIVTNQVDITSAIPVLVLQEPIIFVLQVRSSDRFTAVAQLLGVSHV